MCHLPWNFSAPAPRLRWHYCWCFLDGSVAARMVSYLYGASADDGGEGLAVRRLEYIRYRKTASLSCEIAHDALDVRVVQRRARRSCICVVEACLSSCRQDLSLERH